MSDGPPDAASDDADATAMARGRSVSRRDVLRVGAVGLLAGLSGCAGVSFGPGRGPWFARFLPAPEALNRLLYSPTILRPRRIARGEAPLVARREAERLAAVDPLEFDPDRIDARLGLAQNTTVTVGRFDRETAIGRLRSEGFRPPSEAGASSNGGDERHGDGYAVLTRSRDDEVTVVAVRDRRVVTAAPWHLATAPPARRRVESVIAAEQGSEDRYGEVFPPVADVADAVAGADYGRVVGFPEAARRRLDFVGLDGLRASGFGVAVDDGIGRWVRALVFATPAAVHAPTVRRWVRRARAGVPNGTVEYVRRGRVVEITWRVPVDG